MKNIIEKISKLVEQVADINYPFPEKYLTSNQPTDLINLISTYFSKHPSSYLIELENWFNFNVARGAKPGMRAIVVAPSFNEELRFENYLSLFKNQVDQNLRPLADNCVSHCFIINCPNQAEHIDRLWKGSMILSEKQAENIQFISKIFPSKLAGLGRARKYAFDYALLWAKANLQAGYQPPIVICCEPDTIKINQLYISDYLQALDPESVSLVQGEVGYDPELINQSPSLKLFTEVREAITNGQGLNYNDFQKFHGIMPVGRNLGFTIELYLRSGGIDPIRRPGTDDDINWGVDITKYIGSHVKHLKPIKIFTNPRREALLVSSIISGSNENLKSVYQKFHDDQTIRNLADQELIDYCRPILLRQINQHQKCSLVQQLYQWVLASRLKEHLSSSQQYQKIMEKYYSHELGYWEKEELLWNHFNTYLKDPKRCPQSLEIAEEAFNWFNKFSSSSDHEFSLDNRGLDSVLV